MIDPDNVRLSELAERSEDVTPEKKVGRPPGSKNKSTILSEIINNNVQAQFAEFAEEAATHLMQGVREKDSTCTKIFWDRVMPSQKATDGNVVSAPMITINVSGVENIPEAVVVENEPDGA